MNAALNEMTGSEFRRWNRKALTLMGMSGVGKTTLSRRLPVDRWFHYSGDYRIGTRYLDEAILDNIKREAMKVPFLAQLLRSDSIYICHNITTTNLDPVSTFLGKIGNPELGGIGLAEFKRRQRLYKEAEIAAMRDVRDFIVKGRDLYGYDHFVNDAGGSLCELDDEDLNRRLAADTLIVYLKTSAAMTEELIRRAARSPKPMYYQEVFLDECLAVYLREQGIGAVEQIVPDDFVRWVFPRLVEHRLPRYQEIADRYGVGVDADRIQDLRDEQDVIDLVADALDRRHDAEERERRAARR
jgi:hypothetical protein